MSTPQLQRVPPEVLAAFKEQRLTIVHAVVIRAMERQDEVVQHGEQAEHLLAVGLDFTTQALEVAMSLHDLDMLDYQLKWANERLPYDGVLPAHLLSRLEILVKVIETALPTQDAQAVNQFVGWMINRQRELMQATDE